MILSGDAGIDLYLRNKRPSGGRTFPAEKILLYIPGATYPEETAFDLPIDGVSMMDLIAVRGCDLYLMDIRGYGASTRPPEMNVPPVENAPIVSTDVTVCGSAVEHILQRRGISKIDLMGWSWGTATAGKYTSEHDDNVNRLVLFAPV